MKSTKQVALITFFRENYSSILDALFDTEIYRLHTFTASYRFLQLICRSFVIFLCFNSPIFYIFIIFVIYICDRFQARAK